MKCHLPFTNDHLKFVLISELMLLNWVISMIIQPRWYNQYYIIFKNFSKVIFLLYIFLKFLFKSALRLFLFTKATGELQKTSEKLILTLKNSSHATQIKIYIHTYVHAYKQWDQQRKTRFLAPRDQMCNPIKISISKI